MVKLSAPNNSILIACRPVFNLLFKIQQDKLSASIELYPDFVRAFQALEQLALLHSVTSEELAHLKSCLAMLTDDVMQEYQVLQSIPVALLWPKAYLQSTLLGRKNDDIVFFEGVDKLLKNPKTNLYLIELYYVCLALGLKGECLSSIKLSRLKVRLHQEIIRIRGHAARSLSLGCKQDNIVLTKTAAPIPLSVILILTVFLFSIGIFTIEYILRSEIETHYYYIREQAELLISIASEGDE
ncbi:DotU family type IV/VI secretion system protein [Moritella sp. 24]|uniref:DotU family type IV/VI secretion system protein n=1 Tax=Moritella sp. 24 TaxID=2746230 RepID=UPI001BADA15F|nr:DotU family type IV/VI secretion system protein [Moritella sp. 24]QUM75457.1 DotU family type IV/VI secretion system protein [Moritella sp. 24]